MWFYSSSPCALVDASRVSSRLVLLPIAFFQANVLFSFSFFCFRAHTPSPATHLVELAVVVRIRAKIPRLHLKLSQKHALHVLYLRARVQARSSMRKTSEGEGRRGGREVKRTQRLPICTIIQELRAALQKKGIVHQAPPKYRKTITCYIKLASSCALNSTRRKQWVLPAALARSSAMSANHREVLRCLTLAGLFA